MSADGYDLEDRESGPYCEHWEQPWDCEELCLCGHACRRHDPHDDGCEICDCRELAPPHNEPTAAPVAKCVGSVAAEQEVVTLEARHARTLAALEKANKDNRTLTLQIIRATRERSKLLAVVRAWPDEDLLALAFAELQDTYPKWESWQ